MRACLVFNFFFQTSPARIHRRPCYSSNACLRALMYVAHNSRFILDSILAPVWCVAETSTLVSARNRQLDRNLVVAGRFESKRKRMERINQEHLINVWKILELLMICRRHYINWHKESTCYVKEVEPVTAFFNYFFLIMTSEWPWHRPFMRTIKYNCFEFDSIQWRL